MIVKTQLKQKINLFDIELRYVFTGTSSLSIDSKESSTVMELV